MKEKIKSKLQMNQPRIFYSKNVRNEKGIEIIYLIEHCNIFW